MNFICIHNRKQHIHWTALLLFRFFFEIILFYLQQWYAMNEWIKISFILFSLKKRKSYFRSWRLTTLQNAMKYKCLVPVDMAISLNMTLLLVGFDLTLSIHFTLSPMSTRTNKKSQVFSCMLFRSWFPMFYECILADGYCWFFFFMTYSHIFILHNIVECL